MKLTTPPPCGTSHKMRAARQAEMELNIDGNALRYCGVALLHLVNQFIFPCATLNFFCLTETNQDLGKTVHIFKIGTLMLVKIQCCKLTQGLARHRENFTCAKQTKKGGLRRPFSTSGLT